MKQLTVLFIFLLNSWFFILPVDSSAGTIDAIRSGKKWMAFASEGFMENKGQIVDEKNKPVSEVLYKTSAANADIYITTSGITYIFKKFEKEEENEQEEFKPVKWCRLEMQLQGAMIIKENIIAEEKVEQGMFNYYMGHCPKGVNNVNCYRKLTVPSVYPGIDWVLTFGENGLKYDFIVHPGADPSLIKLKYNGADKLKSIEGLSLQLKTRYALVEEGTLVCYEKETNKTVKAMYVLERSSVRFQTENFDKQKTLVIDPPVHIVNWATYYGGVGKDGPRSICNDAAGNTFITGYCDSDPFPLQSAGGAYNNGTFAASGATGFILKFDNAGVRKWATYFGGSQREFGLACKTDPAGNLFIAGFTGSGDLPMMDPGGGAYSQTVNAGGNKECFISKFNTSGALVWSTFYGGADDEEVRSIDIDAAGNLFLTGMTGSTDFPVMNSGTFFQGTYGGGSTTFPYGDAFILKFNNAGVRQWATYYGGAGDDVGYGIKAGSSGNIYITGMTGSNNFPTLNSAGAYFQAASGGTLDAFVAKFSNNGAQLWSTYYGGSSDEENQYKLYDRRNGSITTDLSENIYITGYTASPDFPTLNPGGTTFFQGTGSGLCPYLVKFRPSGVRVWSTYYGNDGEGSALATDPKGNLYLGGSTTSGSFPTLNPGGGAFFQGSLGGGTINGDIFIAQFDSVGTRSWSTYFGGNDDDWVDGITILPSGCVSLTGEWLSNSGISSTNPGGGAYFQPGLGGTFGNSHNGYVLKFCPFIKADYVRSDTSICAGSCVNFTNTSNPTATAWKWTFAGASTPTSTVKHPTNICYSSSGTFTVKLVATDGNISDSSTKIIIVSSPTLNAGNDTTIIAGTQTTLNATGNVITYSWSPAAGLSNTNTANPVANPTVTTKYILKGVDANNCMISDSVLVIVISDTTCADLFVPTAFSPNNDGQNDIECVLGTCITELQFVIYDRWGEKVFETKDQTKCWDGEYRGKLMNTGIYVYHIIATLRNGETVNKKGNIHLIR
jgi:gliding motility-associated-like protein